MPTVQVTFTSRVGEDVSLPVTIYSDAALTTPHDITGWSMQFVAHLLGGPDAITQTTANGGIVLTAPTDGDATISIPATLTVNLAPGIYCVRIERTDVGADADTTQGTWFLLPR